MFRDAVQRAILVFLVLAAVASAESPIPGDKLPLPRQLQRVNGVLVPVPSEIFGALDRFQEADWGSVLRPDLAAQRPSGDAAHIALSLGIVIAEGLIAVAAENNKEVEDLSKTALKLARALGVEKSVLRRGNSIVDRAHRKDWAAVRKEWFGVDADLKAAMIELQSEQLAQLVSLGGWLRGAEALSTLVSQHYVAGDTLLLHQPVLLDYFRKCLAQMSSKIRMDAVVIESETGINRLRPLIGTEDTRPIPEKGVKEIHAIVGDLVKQIGAKAT
jgi:hypothetical protein